ncbi:MAG TPA: GAF domain-containing protein [Pyrinomonadaceae bacterium]|jgi:hypothetical protein
MAGIPEPKKKRFYHKSWFSEALGIPGALITAIPTITLFIRRVFIEDQTVSRADMWLVYVGMFGVVLLITQGLSKLAAARWKDQHEEDEDRFDGFLSALHLIHSIVRHKAGFSRSSVNRLRVTVQRIVPPEKAGTSPEELEQVLDYIGGKGGGKGRRFSIRSGITGKAAREGEVLIGSRNNDNHEAYIQELMSVWNYTEEDAKKLSSGRNSWMAVPIKYKGHEITGVVYLDSNEKEFFNGEIRELVVWACGGLAVFIDERYK